MIIYEGLVTKSFSEVKRIVGETVYYCEGLQGTEHQVIQPLKPDTEYYWSVRVRRGAQVSDWSRYNYFVFLGLGYQEGRNLLFRFRTPKQ